MNQNIATVSASSEKAPTPLRLRMTHDSSAELRLDRAWWPRSAVLTVELPPLLATLSERLGSIALVGYHRQAWDPSPVRLDRAGDLINLVGFDSEDPPTVIVISEQGRGVSL
ncbi:hypothetical protein BH09ACT8_BH09ACT8_14800 [soil metagenome]